QLDGPRFDAVVQLSRSAMIVDVIDRRWRQLRLFQSQANSASRLFSALFQPHTMIGFACRGVAENFTVNLGAAGFRSLHLFQDEEPGTLRQNETIPISRKRPRRPLGGMIPAGAHDTHELEPAHN